ncbi:MAG: hypothetical protein K8T91_00500 [Planctomycetes bacterium]|nr:hypothetical protein [Planctomycetota bacterium]
MMNKPQKHWPARPGSGQSGSRPKVPQQPTEDTLSPHRRRGNVDIRVDAAYDHNHDPEVTGGT